MSEMLDMIKQKKSYILCVYSEYICTGKLQTEGYVEVSENGVAVLLAPSYFLSDEIYSLVNE